MKLANLLKVTRQTVYNYRARIAARAQQQSDRAPNKTTNDFLNGA